jgi:hypothetical protein
MVNAGLFSAIADSILTVDAHRPARDRRASPTGGEIDRGAFLPGIKKMLSSQIWSMVLACRQPAFTSGGIPYSDQLSKVAEAKEYQSGLSEGRTSDGWFEVCTKNAKACR